MKLLRAGALLAALGSAVPAHGAPAPKTVTTGKLTMTGVGDKPTSTAASRPFAPKTVTTGKLTMTGIADKSPSSASAASRPFAPKTVTTGKLTMTGVGK